MTVSYVDSGSFDYSAGAGDTSFTVPYPNPGLIPAGDCLVLIVGGHLQTSFLTGATCTVDGWTLLGSIDGCGGYSTNASDAGPTSTWAFYKIADGTEFSPVTVNVTKLAVGWGKITQLENDTGLWDLAATVADEQDGGDVDITFQSDPGVKAGDFVVAAFTIPTDLNTPNQFSGSAFSQTGVTYDNASLRSAEADSVVGADVGGLIVNTGVLSGESSDAPVLTATSAGTTTNVRGAAIFVRVREVAEEETPVEEAPEPVKAGGKGKKHKPVPRRRILLPDGRILIPATEADYRHAVEWIIALQPPQEAQEPAPAPQPVPAKPKTVRRLKAPKTPPVPTLPADFYKRLDLHSERVLYWEQISQAFAAYQAAEADEEEAVELLLLAS